MRQLAGEVEDLDSFSDLVSLCALGNAVEVAEDVCRRALDHGSQTRASGD